MVETDTKAFLALLGDVYGLYPAAKPLAGGQVAMFFRALSAHPLAAVQAGLDAHVKDPQRGRFAPLPADVLAQIDAAASNDGRPGAEEAWAIASSSRSEWETVVWTAEIAQALAVCRPVLDSGDDIGARMAFREAYTRMVDEARKARRPAVWTVCEGWDAQRRAVAISAAVECGRLPRSEAPLLGYERPTLAGLLCAPVELGQEAARERARLATEALKNRAEPDSIDVRANRTTEQLKADTAARVSDYERQQQAMRAELALAEEGEQQQGAAA